MSAPPLPTDTFLGTNERIVHVGRIEDRMQSWSNGALHMISGGEHEVMMDAAAVRSDVFDTIAQRFHTAA